MKFHISRTSITDRNKKPYKGAEPGIYLSTNEQTGLKHEERTWIIEINSLSELLDLLAREGQLIIKEHSSTEEPEIEIYDDLRE